MLTDKQLEVVMHLCNGLTIAEIASEMNYSESSIKKHIKLAKQKIGARSNVHLAAIIISKGQIYYAPREDEMTMEGTGTDEQPLAGPRTST